MKISEFFTVYFEDRDRRSCGVASPNSLHKKQYFIWILLVWKPTSRSLWVSGNVSDYTLYSIMNLFYWRSPDFTLLIFVNFRTFDVRKCAGTTDWRWISLSLSSDFHLLFMLINFCCFFAISFSDLKFFCYLRCVHIDLNAIFMWS